MEEYYLGEMTKSSSAPDSSRPRRPSALGPDVESLKGYDQSAEDADIPVKLANPVSNLELFRKLQDSKASRSRKIEEAYKFVKSQENSLDRRNENDRATLRSQDTILMAMPQFVSLLSEWVQSAVLWSSKPQQLSKINDNAEGEESGRVVPAHLDDRYWAILRWCLSSGHLHKFASVSPSLMRPLNLYVITLMESVGSSSQCDSDHPTNLEDSVRSVEILLLANERSFRPDLDHWVSLASTAFSKLADLYEVAIDPEGTMASPIWRLIACILEEFSRFVSIHPNRRKIFTSLTENLLESLLMAHGTLRMQSPRLQSSRWLQSLLQTINEIVEKGLFHAAHVGFFQDACTVLAGKVEVCIEPRSTERKRKRKNLGKDSIGNEEEEVKDKDMRLSYHRLLFRKLDGFRRRRTWGPLMELGWMLEIYSKSFKGHQAAEGVDMFGIKGKGKPQPFYVITQGKNDEKSESKGEGSAKSVHDAQAEKKDRNSEALFMVFVEFVGPLFEDLKSFHGSLLSGKGNLSYLQIRFAKESLSAVVGLLKAAKGENTYVPTEDSINQTHYSFLENCFNTLIGVGKALPSLLAFTEVMVQTERLRDEIKAEVADMLGEMISGLKCLIELDYKVGSKSLGDVWVLVLAQVALQQASRGYYRPVLGFANRMKHEAIQVACSIISIFSDLRQVDQALFSLCVTLRGFMSQGAEVSHLKKQSTSKGTVTSSVPREAFWFTSLNGEAIEFLVCAKPLLRVISLAMQALPEGQVAEFLRLLTVDAQESIGLLDISGHFKQATGPGNWENAKTCVTAGLKGLVELYCCMLENVHIIGTNSIQTGRAVREFSIQIVTPKLVELIGFIASSKISEEDISIVVESNEQKKAILDFPGKRDISGKVPQDDSLLSMWILVFMLRLYITSQSLHGECISLMPPKAAKEVSATLGGPPRDYLRGEMREILTHFDSANFFSFVGRGAIKVSYFVSSIEKKIGVQDLTGCPALGYSLDCVTIQSLAQLSRQIQAASFLLGGCKDVTSVMSNGSIQECASIVESGEVDNEDLGAAKVRKKLQNLLKDLKKEGQKLAKLLLKGVGWQEDNHDVKRIATSSKQSWDLVEATLTIDTLPIQKWNLTCKYFDIWAQYAAEEDLRKFIHFLLSSSSMKTASEEQNGHTEPISLEDCRKKITDDLLCNSLFYEEESFRRIFPSIFQEELKLSSFSAFGKWPFESYSSNSFPAEEVISQMAGEWSDYTRSIEAVIGVEGQEAAINVPQVESLEPFSMKQAFEQLHGQLEGTTPVKGVKLKTSKRRRFDSGKEKALSNQPKNRWSDSNLNALDHCVGLLVHISALPSGYIESSECSICAYTLLCFERLLMSSLLDLRASTLESSPALGTVEHVEVPTVLKLLKAFSTCRSALLALTASDTKNARKAKLTAVLAGSFSSIQWLSLSIHAGATCLVDSLACSNSLEQDRQDIMSSGKCLLHEVLLATGSLVTYISEVAFLEEARYGVLSETAPVAIFANTVKENEEHVSPIKDSKGGGNFLIKVIDYQVETVDYYISSSLSNVLNFEHHGDACDNMSSIITKRCFGGLALSSFLSSYFWSLKTFSENFVKYRTSQNSPPIRPTPAMVHARRLGLVLTESLLSALVPPSSHAVLLLGEHEVDRSSNSGQEKVKIRVVNQPHKVDDSVIMMGEQDEDEDDEELEFSAGVQAAEASADEKDEEHKDVDDMELDERKESSLALQVHDLMLKEEFGKQEFTSDMSDASYTAKSGLQRALLENMLQASCSKKCEIIGELYLALAGILKLESISLPCWMTATISAVPTERSGQVQERLSPAVNVLMGAGYWLLMKAAEDTQRGHWSHLGWLIGVVKYMDAFYCLTPHMKPPLPPFTFSKIFDMNIRLLGSMSPQEQFSSLKLSHPLDVEDQQGISIGQGIELNESLKTDTNAASLFSLRTAVRESLGTLLRNASRQHSVLALQSMMRVLVGLSDSDHSSGLKIPGLQHGRVGSGVAAGIECLSIALEAVSGTRRLRLLANHFHEFFGAIFSIMEYVQGPHLFMRPESPPSQGGSLESESTSKLVEGTVEAGPVVLQALQILITTASRDTIFPMNACQVALALHYPARLFWPVYSSGLSKFKLIPKRSAAERRGPQNLQQAQVTRVVRISTELGVKLYVSCCRLLCSVIRHHRRESGHCIALLGDSARVLLHCLEAPNWPSSENDCAKDWSIKMAAYCANWLRRIYEEMGEHKETLGKYCSHFLSDYLSVLSGHGPHAAGLIREVEAALQPGAFVLVDACSTNDIQQLHAALGEGPRRIALLNLRRQYQQQFKYTGKV